MIAEPTLTTDAGMVAGVLTDAFAADPLFAWVFAEPASRGHCLATWWGHLTAGALDADGAELWSIEGGAGAAMWYAPVFGAVVEDNADVDDADGDRADAGDAGGEDEPNPFVEMLQPLVGERLPEVLDAFGQLVRAHPAEPHWYLPAVGTRERSQGRGLGARLLQPVLERCDDQGLGAYLESSNPRNVPFYFRLGFETIGEIVLGDRSDVIVTMMWRPPR